MPPVYSKELKTSMFRCSRALYSIRHPQRVVSRNANGDEPCRCTVFVEVGGGGDAALLYILS